jgi:hypothetical protein
MSKRPVKLDLDTAIIWEAAEELESVMFSIEHFPRQNKKIRKQIGDVETNMYAITNVLDYHEQKYRKEYQIVVHVLEIIRGVYHLTTTATATAWGVGAIERELEELKEL